MEMRTFLEIAQRFCAPETEILSKYDEHMITVLADQLAAKDPRIPEDQHSAFDKFGVGTLVNAVQIGDIGGYNAALRAGQPISTEMQSKSLALLDLVECLWVTQEDRVQLEEFVKWGVEIGEFPDEANVDDLLYATNYSECIRHNEASRRILAIDQGAPDAADQVQAIYEDTIGSCEEAYK